MREEKERSEEKEEDTDFGYNRFWVIKTGVAQLIY